MTPLPPNGGRIVNALTIDVEDYFHVSVFDGVLPRSRWETLESRVCVNTERLLTIFDEYNVRGTFFVLGWVAQRFSKLVRTIGDRGHEVASHGYAHRLIYDQTQAAFRDDVRRAKAVLEDASGRRVIGYRAPSYSITPRSLWALDVLLGEGYEYDSSIYPIRHDRYGIPISPRYPFTVIRSLGSLIEVPASTLRVAGLNLPIGGGGYFRILPYRYTRWGIRRLNAAGAPAIFYLHPWEIDPEQPRLRAGLLSRFRHYHNLRQCESRLRVLLGDFAFAPIPTLLGRGEQTRRLEPGPSPALPYVW